MELTRCLLNCTLVKCFQHLGTSSRGFTRRLLASQAYLKSSDDWHRVSNLFVNHKSKNSHHSGTAVVELDTTLEKLGLLVKGVPARVDSVTEVTSEFSLASYVLHYASLKESDESYKLKEAGSWDGLEGGPSVRNGFEGGSGKINVSWKVS